MANNDAELKIGFNLEQARTDIATLKSELTDAFKKIDGKGFTALEKRISESTNKVETLDTQLENVDKHLSQINKSQQELSALKDLKLPLQEEIKAEERAITNLQRAWYGTWQFKPDTKGAKDNRDLYEQTTLKLQENKTLLGELNAEELKINETLSSSTSEITKWETGLSEVKTEVSSIATDISAQSSSLEQSEKAQEGVSKDTKEAAENVAELRENLGGANAESQSFSQTMKSIGTSVPDDPLNDLPQKADDATKLNEKLAQLADNARQVNEQMAMDNGQVGIVELTKRLETLTQAERELKKAQIPEGTEGVYQDTIRNIEILKAGISEYKRDVAGLKNSYEQSEQSGTSFGKNVSSAFKSAGSALKGFGKLIDTVKRGFGGLNGTTNKIKSAFNSMASSMRSNFKHMLTNITKYVFGFRSLFFLIRRLRKYIGEGIQNLVQFEGGANPVNEAITDMLSSLLYLKNAWAAAFAPVIMYVRPILVSLIDMLAEVGNAVARFLSFILQSEVTFNAVRVSAGDYADSLGGVGDSAGGAADKVKKLTDRLAAFDDLNVLGKDNDDDDTGSGGGGGGGASDLPSFNDMFKIVDAEENEFLKRLKESWSKADFTWLGELLRDKIIEGLDWLNSQWGTIQEYADKIGHSLGSFLVGLLGDPELWEKSGHAIGEAFNTIGIGISAFLDELEKIPFGKNAAIKVNEFLQVSDWELAGENIHSVLSGILTNIHDFLDELNTENVSTAISDFLTKADVPGLLMDLGGTVLKLTNVSWEITQETVDKLSQDIASKMQLWVKSDHIHILTDENGNEIEINTKTSVDWTEHPLLAWLDQTLTEAGAAIVTILFGVDTTAELDEFMAGWSNFLNVLVAIEGLGISITSIFGSLGGGVAFNWLEKNREVPSWLSSLYRILAGVRLLLGDISALFDLVAVNSESTGDAIRNVWMAFRYLSIALGDPVALLQEFLRLLDDFLNAFFNIDLPLEWADPIRATIDNLAGSTVDTTDALYQMGLAGADVVTQFGETTNTIAGTTEVVNGFNSAAEKTVYHLNYATGELYTTTESVNTLGGAFDGATDSVSTYGTTAEMYIKQHDQTMNNSATNATDWQNTVKTATGEVEKSWSDLGDTVSVNGGVYMNTVNALETETGDVNLSVTTDFDEMATGVDASTTSMSDTINTTWTTLGAEVPENVTLMTDEVYNKFFELSENIKPVFENIRLTVSTKMQETRVLATTEASTLNVNLYNLFLKTQQEGTQQFNTLGDNIVAAFTNMASNSKGPMNNFLSSIERMVNHATDALNRLIDNVNECLKMGSDWLTYMGLPDIGHQGHVPHVTIPRLAEGAVIPPNREFLAVLGDQSHGTNIEAPLDTIKQAVAEVLATNNSNGEVVELLQELIRVVEDKDLTIGDKEIGKANARYVNKQRLIRGTSF